MSGSVSALPVFHWYYLNLFGCLLFTCHVFLMLLHGSWIQAAEQIQKLYKLFIEKDATVVEVNPLVETEDGNGRLFE